jgi:hypothetical protein
MLKAVVELSMIDDRRDFAPINNIVNTIVAKLDMHSLVIVIIALPMANRPDTSGLSADRLFSQNLCLRPRQLTLVAVVTGITQRTLLAIPPPMRH